MRYVVNMIYNFFVILIIRNISYYYLTSTLTFMISITSNNKIYYKLTKREIFQSIFYTQHNTVYKQNIIGSKFVK